jgi:spermidine synthase
MRRPSVILAIFTLSGAAGLIYEIVWSRQLVLVFGNTTQAVSTILTGFFGGMAIGAWFGGRLADRVRSPLRLYGILELLLVAVVLITPFSFRLINEVYRGIYPSLEGTATLSLVRLVLALVALAPATVMMGATFPSLVRHLTRSTDMSASFGALYAANTSGAIVGTLVAGMALIELFGLSGALTIGAGCSAIAGVSAVLLSRGTGAPVATSNTGAAAAAPTATPTAAPAERKVASSRADVLRSPRVRLGLLIAFLSGLTSLGYQVTWTRLLASGTGNTTYVFTIILGIFLIGIAIGSLIFSTIRSRIRDPLRVLATAQVLIAFFAILGLVVVIGHPTDADPSQALPTLQGLVRVALAVVLPTTIVLGIAFPTASALLDEVSSEAGTASGALLAANTSGAIIGSLVIPFVLMPAIGSPSVIVLLAVVNIGLGIWLAAIARPRAFLTAGLAAGVFALTVVSIASGGVVQPNVAKIFDAGGLLYASTEDEIASVQAGKVHATPELWVAGTSMTLLTVDAKLMPILPLIARPNSTRALDVAFGMGTAFRAAIIAGLRTDVVELVPSVPEMFHFYYPDDADAILANPLGRVIIADGRNHLELTSDHFDIIITDPPPPIESSGASVISSLEYYQAGRDHLNPGGVMMQWVPYGAAEVDLKDHIRTFAAVFPNVTIVRGAGGYGMYLLGSDQPVAFDPTVIRQILSRPGVLEDVSSAYDSPVTTVDGWVAEIAKQQWLAGPQVTAYVGQGPLVTDDKPRPEYFLLRRLYGIGAEDAGGGG